MAVSFDISKFRKSITKAIPGLGIGFNDPSTWINTGNFALNYLISGDFNKGVPLGKVTVFAGESGCLPANQIIEVKYNQLEYNRVVCADITEQVSVERLREFYYDNNINEIRVNTPDGFQKIINWYDKGVKPIYRFTTQAHTLRCSNDHLIQIEQEQWVTAESLIVGDEILTDNGLQPILRIIKDGTEECYDFEIDHPNHRYWSNGISSHNSGKSYICSGNLARHAQEQGIFVVLIDSENALDEKWLHALGVDTSEDKLLKLNLAMIDDVALTISEFVKEYSNTPVKERQKVLFIIDSLGMLLTPTDVKQFADGDLKGDLGRKPKALTALIRNCVNQFGTLDLGLVCTNHVYGSLDMFDPDDKISGGNGQIFASSIVVAIKKRKLKEDDAGVKVTNVLGIRSACKIMKSRYAQPFTEVEVQIPYTTGMNPYSGLFDLMEKNHLLTKNGNKYSYLDTSGNLHNYFRKDWYKNINGIYDLVMQEWDKKVTLVEPITEIEEDEDDNAITHD